MTRGRIAMVVSGFPRRSETFALGELLALDRAALLAGVFATKPGDGAAPHPDVARLGVPVETLPQGTPREQADALVARLRRAAVSGVHGYFAHRPAAVAACAARQLRVPYGFTGHARDVRKVPGRELTERAHAARCVIACNADVAGELGALGIAARRVPHGIDVDRFRPAASVERSGPLRLLAVGRLVEKKGFDVLVRAVARLDIPFELRIVGDGPEAPRLLREIDALHLQQHVELAGGRTHADLPAEYAAADLVVVPSVVDRTGDRDGLPNVILEAMACARPVIASDVGAIASAVADGRTGWLVPPGQDAPLEAAIRTCAARADLRHRFGAAGRAQVEREFALTRCVARLQTVMVEAYA